MTRRRTPGQVAVRAVIALGPPVALLATGPAGAWPSVLLVALVVVLSVGFAAFPESAVGSAAFVLVLAWWGVGLRDGLHPMALVAAGALVAAHVAAVLAAYGPGDLVPDPGLVRLWLVRGALVFLTAPVLLLVMRALRGAPEPPLLWASAMAAAVAVLVLAGVLFDREPGR